MQSLLFQVDEFNLLETINNKEQRGPVYSEFLKYVSSENLFTETDKLLLGISGGVDSVVLSHLVEKHGNQFALAHCNFNLRGKDSDDDEQFVRSLADKLGVKLYVASFQTKEYANENGISIEMAARELRYDWFAKLRESNQFDWLLVGHHSDDVLETFILNLSRGTGIRGLSGIKNKIGKVVRPLLFASRNEIEAYANQLGLTWRNDQSNDDTTIKRNKVRHQIIPLLEELNPAFRKNLDVTIQNLKSTETVFLHEMNMARNKLVLEERSWIKISKAELLKLNPASIYLYEILREYHFNSEVVTEIMDALEGESGSRFFSSSHRLVIDRDELIITPIQNDKKDIYYIDKDEQFIEEPIPLKISVERYTPDYKIPTTKDIGVFDFDLIKFPFVLRHWIRGEYFKPLGLNGLKKVSDFFIDEKMSIPEKENAWILSSENKVAWIVGRRIDDRFKLTPDTKLVLRIELINSGDAKERTF